jgi:arginine deiminase
MWLDPATVLLGVGLRTNREGATQVAATLAAMGVETVLTALPAGTMHLMGQLRIVDRGLALYWPGLIGEDALDALRSRGYTAVPFPDLDEARTRMSHNFVTLAPREILMPAECPASRAAYEERGVTCRTVAIDEVAKAAGGIGCLTGVVRRLPAG